MSNPINQQVVISHPRTASRYVAEKLGILTNAAMRPYHSSITLGREVNADNSLIGSPNWILHTHFHSIPDIHPLIDASNVVFTEIVRSPRERFMSGVVVQSTGLVNGQKIPEYVNPKTAHRTIELMMRFEEKRQAIMGVMPMDRYRKLDYKFVSTRPATDYTVISNWMELDIIFSKSELNTP